MLMLNWIPDRHSNISLHIQIKEHIITCIKKGALDLGEKLPTQTTMANAFEVNRSTIIAALDELKAEGIIVTRTKKGTYISNDAWHVALENSWFNWKNYTTSGSYESISNISKSILINENKNNYIWLHAGELSQNIVTTEMVQTLTKRLVNVVDQLPYCDPKGLLKTRMAISNYYKKFGVTISPNEILLTNGISQAFHLLSLGIINSNNTILMEKPSYLFSLKTFQSANINMRGIPMTKSGINLSKLKEAKKHSSAKLLFLNPYFHNPTSICTTPEHSKKILEMCFSLKLPIIEDDTYRELYFEGNSPKPLIAYDKHKIVLHLASISKQLFPGLRIGWVIGPTTIIDRLCDVKSQIDLSSSIYDQTALFELLNSGLYDKYTQDVRDKLKENRDYALKLLNLFFKDLATWTKPAGGFYIWLTLKSNISPKKLFDACLEEKIIISPGILYHHTARKQIRLSFAYASKSELSKGLWTLSQIIRSYSGINEN